MGPRHEWRGNNGLCPHDNKPCWLQWGRATNGAEIVDIAKNRVTVAPASMGPRHEWRGNAVFGTGNALYIRMLQWGRATNGAEIGEHQARERPHVASMGPRHEWRGNEIQIAASLSRQHTLQWGRATNGAEISWCAL